MGVVERDAQLARLNRLLEECVRTAGGTAVVTGPLASGKSALLRAFSEQAAAAGALVLDAVGSSTECDVPLEVLRQLFEGAPLTADERAGVEKLLTDASLHGSRERDATGARRLPTLASRQLWSILCGLSERVPVVVAIDDLHYADDASLHSLGYFSGRAGSARILLVATAVRTLGAVDRLPGVWLADLLRQPQFHQVRVAPLSEGGVAAVAAERLGADEARRLARPWHRLTGGNPLLVTALLEEAQACGEPAEEAGEEYGKAVVACVRRGGRHLLRVARGMAVLGGHASVPSLRRLLDLPEQTVEALRGMLVASGVADVGGFRHPAAARALLAGCPAEEREELHRRAAVQLHRQGASPCEVAGQLVAAGRGGEPWTFEVLEAAAGEALRRDEIEFATACLDLAERVEAAEERRWSALVLRTRVEFRNNPLAAFRRLAPLREALREGRLEGGHAVALISPLLWQGWTREARMALERVDGAVLDAWAAVELGGAREWVRAAQAPVLAERLRVLEPAGVGERGRPVWGVGEGAGTLSRVLREGGGQEVVGAAEAVLQSLSLDDASFCSIQSALLTLVYADRAELAAGWCDDLLREASTRRASTWQALLMSVRAEVSWRTGDPAGAHRHARSALSVIPEQGWGVAVGSPKASLLLAAGALGEREPVVAGRGGLPEAMFQTRFGAQYLYAVGRRHLVGGRAQAAWEALEAAGRLLVSWGIDLPSFVPWRVDGVSALWRLGRREEARELAAEQFSRPGAQGARTRGMALRALAVTVDPHRRAVLLEEAADLLEEGGDRGELACALAELSGARQALGQGGKARMALRRAVRLAEECGLALAGRWSGEDEAASVAARRVARLDGLDCGEELSSAERRVAELAAAGQTNREISRELFITVSTVEQHLTRVYRKLGVSGRESLPAALAPARRSG